MKVYRSEDQLVSKYTHVDESETSIKVVPSKDTALTGEVRINDREKYTIFISSSKGCYLKCGFCDLTVAGMPYSRLVGEQITWNVLKAVTDKAEYYPDIKNRYVKLSWMGMGDALPDAQMVREVSLYLLRAIMDNGYAAGIDGVDLSTSFAYVKDPIGLLKQFVQLNDEIEETYTLNPNNKRGRSAFRLFYSLQTVDQRVRDNIVPNTLPVCDVLPLLRYVKRRGVQVIFHYVVLDGVNDSTDDAHRLALLLSAEEFADDEVRLLRYNPHPDSPYVESTRRLEFANEVAAEHPNLKVQVSEGLEVRSACGQFMWGQDG